MKEIRTETEDKQLRELMRSAAKKAPENLQYRIMHQIEAEHALTRKKALSKKSVSLLRDLGNIFGQCILLATIVGGAYLLLGEAFLQSPKFLGNSGIGKSDIQHILVDHTTGQLPPREGSRVLNPLHSYSSRYRGWGSRSVLFHHHPGCCAA